MAGEEMQTLVLGSCKASDDFSWGPSETIEEGVVARDLERSKTDS